jgi:chloramphenicol 3-O-phosphotransferase
MQTNLEDAVARRTFLYPVRWGAIFAGMAVGIALHLMLMVVGLALGLAVFDFGDRPDAQTASRAAAAWNAISMLVGAFVGGYIAARASGLRRLGDGVLHGAVSWGATTLLFAALTLSAAGGALGGLYSTLAPRLADAAQGVARDGGSPVLGAMPRAVTDAVRRGDRDAVVAAMQDGMGMSPDQAERAADVALALGGRAGGVAASSEQQAERAADAGAKATGWLAGAILLSLVVALIGGALGARSARRFTRLQHRLSEPASRPAPAATGEMRLS